MTQNATIDYIMEDPREAARLEAKVDPKAWVQKYLAHRVHPGADVLSVGCGPGVILSAVTGLHSSIKGTGIDVSADRVQEAIHRNRENSRVEFVCGDAQAMQFPSDSFDLVYTRMLLQYLRDKEKAVAEMVRVCRPGGTVFLQDLDGQLLWHYPEDTALQHGIEKVVTALAATGFDPFVGRKLYWLAHRAGLQKLHVQVESYHLIAGAAEPHILRQWELKLDIAKAHMAKVFGSKAEAEDHVARFLQYLHRPETLTYSTVFTVTGEKTSRQSACLEF
jgi:ubiquinone/menaquinone biosynthesis C-methylase UbiE